MGAVARGARAVTRSGRSEPLDLAPEFGDCEPRGHGPTWGPAHGDQYLGMLAP